MSDQPKPTRDEALDAAAILLARWQQEQQNKAA